MKNRMKLTWPVSLMWSKKILSYQSEKGVGQDKRSYIALTRTAHIQMIKMMMKISLLLLETSGGKPDQGQNRKETQKHDIHHQGQNQRWNMRHWKIVQTIGKLEWRAVVRANYHSYLQPVLLSPILRKVLISVWVMVQYLLTDKLD